MALKRKKSRPYAAQSAIAGARFASRTSAMRNYQLDEEDRDRAYAAKKAKEAEPTAEQQPPGDKDAEA